MSIKASSLKQNEAQKRTIKKEVNNIIANIDNEIKNAHDQGKNLDIRINVPIVFAIPYMSNADAQRMIYFGILKSLLDREFIVEIDMQKDATVFHVSWLSEDEKQDIIMQNALIAKHTRHRL